MHSYRAAGLAVASEIELPGAIPAQHASAPDITVRAATVPANLDDASKKGATWQIAGDRFLLQVPGMARFLLSGGREILFEAAPGVPASDVSIFIIGTVFGILLHQRGEIVLHASAVPSGAQDDEYDEPENNPPVRFVKVHDAYTLTPLGEPLLAGARGAEGAIVVVRDPRDIVPSLANHSSITIDEAIAFICNRAAAFSDKTNRQPSQLRQKLPGWTGHIASWLDQSDIPVHLIRYEDLQADALGVLRGVLAFAGRAASEDEMKRAVAFADFAQLRQQEQSQGFREAPRPWTDGRFFRRGQTGGWRDELTPAQAARIEAEHADMMRRLGYQVSSASALALTG